MIISIVNFTSMPDAEVQRVIRAINRQIHEDFEPYWHMSARLRLEGKATKAPIKDDPPDLRGDGILYLYDGKPDVAGALGYHEQTQHGIPYGFVFTKLASETEEPWNVTLSHEALEMIGDANVNQLAVGPHPDPKEKGRDVFHWYEMCDAVQDERYVIDGVEVSNFVLPLYFTPGDQLGSRNDFMGQAHGNKYLTSFGVNPGGYVGFFDPETGEHETFSADSRGKARLAAKAAVKGTRRAIRLGETPEPKRPEAAPALPAAGTQGAISTPAKTASATGRRRG